MKYLAIILWLCLTPITAWGQLKATGVATWQDTVAGTSHGAMGMGGVPTLCYQKDGGEWDFIVDDWQQVGEKQVWKSVRGNHRVFADSTSAAIYAKGEHYLGTKTTHLIKFKKADSTWERLKASMPDSVRTSNHRITFHNIFPGVDKTLTNNAKVFRSYSEKFTFHQEARDSLATWGPWAGHLLGTATKLTTDSLNLTLRDAAGIFGIDATGRMVDEWIQAEDDSIPVFCMATAYLETEDSLVQSIPVRKWLVLYAGSPWLIELFNPIAAAALPDGDIWHNATFGYSTIGGDYESTENYIRGFVGSPASNGDVDSITAYIMSGSASRAHRMALYVEDTDIDDQDIVDTTAEWSFQDNSYAWISRPTIEGASILSTSQYSMAVWSYPVSGFARVRTQYTGQVSDTLWFYFLAYNNAWPNPITTLTETTHNALSIYCTYTEAGEPSMLYPFLKD